MLRSSRSIVAGTSIAMGASVIGLLSPPSNAATSSVAPRSSAAVEACHPTDENRPVCAQDAELDEAAFLDPTAVVTAPGNVGLSHRVYVGPFALLAATKQATISIGAESNVQDNVRVRAVTRRTAETRAAMAGIGLSRNAGVEIGERVILAHGSSVRGPARLGVVPEGQGTDDSGVFISFGARVDGAIIERDSGLSTLSRVGPGVRLRSGFIVLPGKNVTTQAQADNPALGKVRPIVEADKAFNAGVVEVNVGLAREYSRLARQNPRAVHGINVDPGGNSFDQHRDAPSVRGSHCTGPHVRKPGFRNRIIGDACFEDSVKGLDRKMGSRISIRADEGGPFGIGRIDRMRSRVIFHALEHTDLRVGEQVHFGKRAIVHGGGRPQVDPTTGLAAPTLVGNDVRLGAGSVVFRSLVRNKARIGIKSAVVGSELRVGQRVRDRVIYANDEVFGPVEW